MSPFLETFRRRTSPIFALIALIALLTSCTVYVVDGDRTDTGRVSVDLALDDVITSFTPVRGVGATYRIGQPITFELTTRRDGFVTLTAIDPDGSVYPIARNLRVSAGRVNVLDGSQVGVRFIADPPTGLHRVRASFTSSRTDTGRVQYRGRSGDEGWTSAIRIELRAAEVRDVAETYFYIERR